ncbi:MAG: sigma-54-dependent Fis family transcriptional regulator [Proteobacteria bacterium]|nr:sigma-54-dependent Fis family transcriptional regulator [Pseudomonadota bacterium]
MRTDSGMTPTLLVIDDNPAVATALEVLFSLRDIATLRATSPDEGLALLEREPVDLVVQDMNFSADTTSGDEGRELFARIRARHPDLPVILLTAWTHLESAVDLVRAGAADYIGKPWDDRKLMTAVANLLELGASRRELRRHRGEQAQRNDELRAQHDLRGMVFADAATERLLGIACQVARADVSVLITGPNGSGKERIAQIVQANSAVKDGPFVTLDCGALPSELIEAELFGADAGAYTGANKSREGKFEAADGGTLFLDEIANLPLAGQVKLLRVLETSRFARLGSNRERSVRVRVISATNADLQAKIADGTFREDLYYRINLIELRLPPLAERPDDILPLAEHFLSGHDQGSGKALSREAREALRRYPWPGNVRELKNVIRRASLLAAGDTIAAADLDLPIANHAEPDRMQIEQALARAQGVIAQAAAQLGMSRQSLYRRMERLGIARG